MAACLYYTKIRLPEMEGVKRKYVYFVDERTGTEKWYFVIDECFLRGSPSLVESNVRPDTLFSYVEIPDHIRESDIDYKLLSNLYKDYIGGVLNKDFIVRKYVDSILTLKFLGDAIDIIQVIGEMLHTQKSIYEEIPTLIFQSEINPQNTVNYDDNGFLHWIKELHHIVFVDYCEKFDHKDIAISILEDHFLRTESTNLRKS